MKTISAASKTLVASLALSIACLFAFGSANASAADFNRGPSGNHDRDHDNHGRDGDRWHGDNNNGHYNDYNRNRGGFSFNFGNFGWGGYGGGYNRVWVDGCYENELQRVLVVPEHTERRFIGGYWKDVCVPAVYENRYVKVWHAGYYR